MLFHRVCTLVSSDRGRVTFGQFFFSLNITPLKLKDNKFVGIVVFIVFKSCSFIKIYTFIFCNCSCAYFNCLIFCRDEDWCVEGNTNTLSFPSYYIDENVSCFVFLWTFTNALFGIRSIFVRRGQYWMSFCFILFSLIYLFMYRQKTFCLPSE